MKKALCVILTAILLLTAAACRPDVGIVREDAGTNVYFIRKDSEGRKYFDTEKRVIKGLELNNKIDNILIALKAPRSRGAYAALPQHISVVDSHLEDGILYLDLGPSYRYLDAESRLIVSTAMCMTVFDANIAKYIRISCEGVAQAPLYDKSIFKSSINTDERIYLN